MGWVFSPCGVDRASDGWFSQTKMVYVASLNDQVVPIYSGLFTAASHPRILRALYIDGDAYRFVLRRLMSSLTLTAHPAPPTSYPIFLFSSSVS